MLEFEKLKPTTVASGELTGDGERDATSLLLDALAAANGSINSSSSNVNLAAKW